MANHASPAPAKRGPSRAVVIAIVVGAVVAVLIVVAAVFTAVGPSGSPDSGNSQGADAGGSPLPADSAGAPSVAGPTDDPAAPVEASPVPLDSPAIVTEGLTASIGDIAAVDGFASGVGEIGGPSLKFTVSATNTGRASLPLQTAVIGLTYGSNSTPAIELTSASTPLPAEVAPGQTVTGAYVFVVPTEARGDIRITLDYRVGTPVSVFEGSAAG